MSAINGTPAQTQPPYSELERLLREAYNSMDEVRCSLLDRADRTGINSVLAMTLADSLRDIRKAGYGDGGRGYAESELHSENTTP